MARRAEALERMMRVALVLYPRDFRRQLSSDMAAVFVREAERIERQHGSARAWRYVIGSLAAALAGVVPAHWNRVLPRENVMDALLQDTRYALRNLRRGPAFVAVAVLSLALGIGANTAIFSVVNAVLLQPMPYQDADRLMVLWESNESIGADRYGPSGVNFRDWRERSQVFEDMMLFQPGSATITDLAEPEQVPGMRVTTNFLSLLGYEPALGRDFRADENSGGRRNVVIFSHGFWQRAYGGDPEIIGTEMMGDHIPYTVIGVLPEDFWYPLRVDLLVPWDEDELFDQDRRDREYAAIGRIRPGATLQEARLEMAAIGQQLAAEYPEQEGWTITVVPISEEGAAYLRPALLVLLGAVAFVLLIACANVANLLLARGTSRQREIAIRAASGASRGRLLFQLLVESSVLAGLGGLAGWFVGVAGVRALTAVLPSEVPLPGGVASILVPDIGVDVYVLGFAAAVSLITGFVFGLAPAWQLSIADLAGGLRESDRGSSDGGGKSRVRNLLVIAEVALALVLLVGTLLMIQSFWNLSRVDLGFVPERVVTLQIELPTDSKYQTNEERSQFYSEVLPHLEAIPAVRAAGISEVLPLDTVTRRTLFRIEGSELDQDLGTNYNLANAGYFEAIRIPLLRGRMFTSQDDLAGETVALIDDTFARAYFPGEDPIGREIVAWGRPRRIIGVVGAVRSVALDARPEPMLYLHSLQSADNMMTFLLLTRGEPGEVVQAAKEAVWAVDPEQPVFNVRSMEAVVAGRASSTRMTMALLAVFGAVAVLMAALGVYGVMSYAVGQRTHEIGLRQALGARRRDLLAMILREAGALTVVGVAIGIGVSLLLARSLSTLLYGVSPSQPAAYAAVAALITLVAVLATWLPARRAARIDPMVALRSD